MLHPATDAVASLADARFEQAITRHSEYLATPRSSATCPSPASTRARTSGSMVS